MKIKIKILLFIYTINYSAQISMLPNGGRLGDQLICYMHAKWISYNNSLPLTLVPFKFSEDLRLNILEKRKISESQINRLIKLNIKYKEIQRESDINTTTSYVYVCPYFPESIEEHRPRKCNNIYKKFGPRNLTRPYFKVNWDDPEFKKILRQNICPINKLNLIEPPKNVFSIALHIRKSSGGYDLPMTSDIPKEARKLDQLYVDLTFPWKHPPDSYYIEQLKWIIEENKHKKIFIYMFTDHPDQNSLIEKYEKEIDNPNIIWACRTTENNHYSNVLEDLFSMAWNFDCLIRGDSNLAIVADIIGNHQVTICPNEHEWINNELYITEAKIKRVYNEEISYSNINCSSHKLQT